MTDEFSEPRRRQASAESLAAREAAEVVRDLNRRLGVWQAGSVKLHTMAQRLKSSGRDDPAVVDEALALYRLVASEADRFELMLEGLPDTISHHGRINDTRRSFEMIRDRLGSLLALMGVPADRDEGRVD